MTSLNFRGSLSCSPNLLDLYLMFRPNFTEVFVEDYPSSTAPFLDPRTVHFVRDKIFPKSEKSTTNCHLPHAHLGLSLWIDPSSLSQLASLGLSPVSNHEGIIA